MKEAENVETKTEPPSPSPPIDIKSNATTSEIVIEPIPSPFSSPIKLESIVDRQSSTTTNDASNDNLSEYFYEFQPENFHAEQVRKIFSLSFHLERFPLGCSVCLHKLQWCRTFETRMSFINSS